MSWKPNPHPWRLILLVWGLALSSLPVELDALRIGRTYYIIGPTLGDHVAKALSAAGDLRHEKAVLSAQISVARQRYWALYPDGEGFAAAEEAFREALQQKDMQLFLEFGAISDDEVIWALDVATGEVDDGVPLIADDAFYNWKTSYRQWRQEGLSVLEAYEKSQRAYQRYAAARDLNEFAVAGRTPPGFSEPQWLIFRLLMTQKGTRQDSKGRWVPTSLSAGEIIDAVELLYDTFGNEAVDRVVGELATSTELGSGRLKQPMPAPPVHGGWSDRYALDALMHRLTAEDPFLFLVETLRKQMMNDADLFALARALQRMNSLAELAGRQALEEIGRKYMAAAKVTRSYGFDDARYYYYLADPAEVGCDAPPGAQPAILCFARLEQHYEETVERPLPRLDFDANQALKPMNVLLGQDADAYLYRAHGKKGCAEKVYVLIHVKQLESLFSHRAYLSKGTKGLDNMIREWSTYCEPYEGSIERIYFTFYWRDQVVRESWRSAEDGWKNLYTRCELAEDGGIDRSLKEEPIDPAWTVPAEGSSGPECGDGPGVITMAELARYQDARAISRPIGMRGRKRGSPTRRRPPGDMAGEARSIERPSAIGSEKGVIPEKQPRSGKTTRSAAGTIDGSPPGAATPTKGAIGSSGISEANPEKILPELVSEEVSMPSAVIARCGDDFHPILSTLVRGATRIDIDGREEDGCQLELHFSASLSVAVEHYRRIVASTGFAIDEEKEYPSLGGRHLGRRFLRFSDPQVRGSLILDEYASPPGVVILLRFGSL